MRTNKIALRLPCTDGIRASVKYSDLEMRPLASSHEMYVLPFVHSFSECGAM